MKLLLNKYRYLLLLQTVLLFAVACRSSKETNALTDYKTFSAPVELEYQTKENAPKNTVKGQLQIIKDNAVQISIRIPIINTEAVRITVTPDGFTFIDRINKIFVSEPLDKLKFLIHSELDFADLQKLLTTQQTIPFEKDGIHTVIRILKSETNKEFELDTTIPQKYKQIPIERLINRLSGKF
ncbi:MAG: DUF4292 domain-containing protein [Dysgonamonadaceae bacterium]|jgi:hypothetical protein|nr:DUF4292 domain-containing protein [Dysgonamonadaceae bacterium]